LCFIAAIFSFATNWPREGTKDAKKESIEPWSVGTTNALAAAGDLPARFVPFVLYRGYFLFQEQLAARRHKRRKKNQ
jgi:hypothetical protein